MHAITDRILRIPAVSSPVPLALMLAMAVTAFASARADDEVVGVGEAFDAAELVPASPPF